MNNLLWAFAAAIAIALAPAAEAAFSGLASSSPAHRASLVQLSECDEDCREHVQDYVDERDQQSEAAREARHDAIEERNAEYEHTERRGDPREIETMRTQKVVQQNETAARQIAADKQKTEPDAKAAKAKAVKEEPASQLAT